MPREVTTEEALSELQRERNVRERCYDRWVERGQLTAVDARDRMARLDRAIEILNKVHDLESIPVPRNGDMTDNEAQG